MTTLTATDRERVTHSIEVWLVNDLGFLLAAKDVLHLAPEGQGPRQLAETLAEMVFGRARWRLKPSDRHVVTGLHEFFNAVEFRAADWDYLARRVRTVDIGHLWTPPKEATA